MSRHALHRVHSPAPASPEHAWAHARTILRAVARKSASVAGQVHSRRARHHAAPRATLRAGSLRQRRTRNFLPRPCHPSEPSPHWTRSASTGDCRALEGGMPLAAPQREFSAASVREAPSTRVPKVRSGAHRPGLPIRQPVVHLEPRTSPGARGRSCATRVLSRSACRCTPAPEGHACAGSTLRLVLPVRGAASANDAGRAPPGGRASPRGGIPVRMPTVEG